MPPKPDPTFESLFMDFLRRRVVWALSLAAAGAFGIFGLGVVVNSYIDSRAESAVKNQTVLNEIARKIAPSLIFDTRGSFVQSLGAEEFVEKIAIEPVPESYGYRVHLHSKKSFSHPILTGLNISLFAVETTRSAVNDWTILLAPNATFSVVLDGGKNIDTNGVFQFRLEILR